MPRGALWLPLGALLLTSAAGCRCPAKPERRGDPTAAPAPPGKPKVSHFPSQALRYQMRRLEVLTKEIRRRARRGQLGNAPKVLGKVIAEMPSYGSPKTFVAGMGALGQLARQLEDSKSPVHHYGLLVEGCVSCHEKLAPALVGQVTRLRLPVQAAGGKQP